MKFQIISLFPNLIEAYFSEGVVGQAWQHQHFAMSFIDPRKYSEKKYKNIDERPFGGGDGMLMQAEALQKSVEEAQANAPKALRILFSPQGQKLNQKQIRKLSQEHKDFILVCGRYAGVDQRFVNSCIDLEVSIGDYIVSGGEIAAMVFVDAMARSIEGVLGNNESFEQDSFSHGLLECPQFTRPQEYNSKSVPSILLSGDHKKIKEWRYLVSLLKTKQLRPDLFAEAKIKPQDWQAAMKLWQDMSVDEKELLALQVLD